MPAEPQVPAYPPGVAQRGLPAAVTARVSWVGAFALQHLWLAIPLLALPALSPFWVIGLPKSADGEIHLLRSVVLGAYLQQGVLYPRWLPDFALGYGFPVFNYYAPASYYIVDALHGLGLGYPAAFILSLALLVVAAGMGMFLLARELFERRRPWLALVAATAYMYAPYLLINVYIRGALAEVAAQALLPWILWGLRRLFYAERPALHLLPVTLTLGLLALTHNITLLLAPPLLIGYGAVLWWQRGRPASALRWAVISAALAVGLTAFFLVPLVVERSYLTDDSYRLAAQTFMPENPWKWNNFLDLTLRYGYSFSIPFRLGLIQTILAAAGIAVAATRRRLEWWFWILAALLSALAIGEWALPFWVGNRVTLTVQFPWRLLAILSVPLALFAAASLSAIRSPLRQAGVSLIVIAIVVAAQTPDLRWMDSLGRDYEDLTLPAIARYEASIRQPGINYTGELRPLWAGSPLDAASPVPAPQFDIAVQRADAFGAEMSIASAAGGPLRFTEFYFPGWQVRLDGHALKTYPSTSVGLLTADIPQGSHQVTMRWEGTRVQRWATVLSLLTLAALAWLCWRFMPGRRWLAALPLAVLLAAGWATYRPQAMGPVAAPTVPVRLSNMQLLGYRVERPDPRTIELHPYWYIQAPVADVWLHWRLEDQAGQVASETISRPYFDSVRATGWYAGTLVDDAYQLTLPPDLPSGVYRLRVGLQYAAGTDSGPLVTVGSFPLSGAVTAPPELRPTHVEHARFGDQAEMVGYDLSIDYRPLTTEGRDLLVARPGDVLDYTIYWRATRLITDTYRSGLILLDSKGQVLTRKDTWAGAPFSTSASWDLYRSRIQTMKLKIPGDAAGQLYWARLGLYQLPYQLLPAADEKGNRVADTWPLSPVKIVDDRQVVPEHPVKATIGHLAVLTGYNLQLPTAGLRPGSTFTLTLHYLGKQTTPVDYTRFVHLYAPQTGMAAQYDSLPAGGANPTWSWQPGESITDTVPLRVAADALPGTYTLGIGFYDHTQPASRLPLSDELGRPLPDNQAALTTLTIEPP